MAPSLTISYSNLMMPDIPPPSKLKNGDAASQIRQKQKQKRTPKAPDAPRRPLSAYNLFFKRERALIVAGQISDINDEADATPSSLPVTTTPPTSPIVIGGSYSGMLSASGHTIVQTVEGTKARKLKRCHRKTHGKIGFTQLARLIGQKWKNLDDETRRPYQEQAKVEKARYQEELRKYRERKQKEAKQQEAEEKKRKESTKATLMMPDGMISSDNRHNYFTLLPAITSNPAA